MSKELTNQTPAHIDPYKAELRNHVPAVGDYYASKNPHYNTRSLFRLTEKTVDPKGYVSWKIQPVYGADDEGRTISDDNLREYYRPLLNGFEDIRGYAEMIVAGKSAEVAALLSGGQGQEPADTEELMASGSRQQVKALLDESERARNLLEEIRLTADIIIENKKAELEARLGEMEGFLEKMNKKVNDLVKVITVLNLYTGKTVDVNVIAEGEPADPSDPLSLRQRTLYMDEELCANLDHEADYNDIPLFFGSLRDPSFRDIIAPEPRCVVAVKPKRRAMGYNSGDPFYDAARDMWNKHTYVVIRNGDNLWWLESDDLEVRDTTFPHEDFEETFRKRMSDPRTSFKDSLVREHEMTRYLTTKYMVFLQGLIDSKDLIGPTDIRPNLMRLTGVNLIRDDENLIGTGRIPWNKFRDNKNTLIRRGTRVLYDGGGTLRDGRKRWNAGGEVPKYYTYEQSEPEPPESGIYHADTYERVERHEKGKPVKGTADFLVFRYLPGDTVWKRNEWGYHDEAERRNKVAWKYEKRHVLNYDAVTTEELQGYLSDRTLRPDFREMMPLLKKALLEKREEEADERAFKALVTNEVRKETGSEPDPATVDEAVEWWKGKVIFTRPLRQDDAKAFRMIKDRLTSLMKRKKEGKTC